MKISGYSRCFQTKGGVQYDTIGRFWDELSAQFGMENLIGLGFNWTRNTIEYLIGLKYGEIGSGLFREADYRTIILPDKGWLEYRDETENLKELYSEIWNRYTPKYELEEFWEDGTCRVRVYPV